MRHTRVVPHGDIRAIEVDGKPGVRLQIIRYGVVDSYGWLWMPGCFDKAIRSRMPTLAWGHSWSDVIGRATTYVEDSGGPILDFYLDDFDAVPRARQAYAQIKSGTIDDCSVGFNEPVVTREPTDEERSAYPGVMVVCESADLDEVSLVLRGAVPGAKVLQTRTRGAVIDAEQAGQIMAKLQVGEITLKDALQAVEDAQVDASTAASADADDASEDDEATHETPDADVTDEESDNEDGDDDADDTAADEHADADDELPDIDAELANEIEEALAIVGGK